MQDIIRGLTPHVHIGIRLIRVFDAVAGPGLLMASRDYFAAYELYANGGGWKQKCTGSALSLANAVTLPPIRPGKALR